MPQVISLFALAVLFFCLGEAQNLTEQTCVDFITHWRYPLYKPTTTFEKDVHLHHGDYIYFGSMKLFMAEDIHYSIETDAGEKNHGFSWTVFWTLADTFRMHQYCANSDFYFGHTNLKRSSGSFNLFDFCEPHCGLPWVFGLKLSCHDKDHSVWVKSIDFHTHKTTTTSLEPSNSPSTDKPTNKPTAKPTTSAPSPKPTTPAPTPKPSPKPTTPAPTPKPSPKPTTPAPTPKPSPKPTTPAPTPKPSQKPTTPVPSPKPSHKPTTPIPSPKPSPKPTTPMPSPKPSHKPTTPAPSPKPSHKPTTPAPSPSPTTPAPSPAPTSAAPTKKSPPHCKDASGHVNRIMGIELNKNFTFSHPEHINSTHQYIYFGPIKLTSNETLDYVITSEGISTYFDFILTLTTSGKICPNAAEHTNDTYTFILQKLSGNITLKGIKDGIYTMGLSVAQDNGTLTAFEDIIIDSIEFMDNSGKKYSKGKKKYMWVFWLVLVIFLVVASGLACAAVHRGRKKSNLSKESGGDLRSPLTRENHGRGPSLNGGAEDQFEDEEVEKAARIFSHD